MHNGSPSMPRHFTDFRDFRLKNYRFIIFYNVLFYLENIPAHNTVAVYTVAFYSNEVRTVENFLESSLNNNTFFTITVSHSLKENLEYTEHSNWHVSTDSPFHMRLEHFFRSFVQCQKNRF